MATRIMIVAGEASGDLHGAHLARKIKDLDPTAEISGMGGSMMAQAGVNLLFDPTAISAMGFIEVLRSAQVLRQVRAGIVAKMAAQKPDVLVLIDFPGFNMGLAKMAHRRHISVVYYISPSAWAWGRGRALKVARSTDCVCSIFPFEADVYRRAGAQVCYVGHPLLDVVHRTAQPATFLFEIGLKADKPFFALLPGSREQEIRLLLPPMLEAAEIIAAQVPGAQFALPIAHTVPHHLIEGYLAGHPNVAVRLVEGRTHDLMAAAAVAIIASGTATLEAAILGTPMVMVYKMAPSTYRILKRLVKIKLFALPNIVAGRQIILELIQNAASPDNIAAEAVEIWRSPQKREIIAQGYAEVLGKLGESGAVARTAQAVLAVARHEDPLQYTVEGM